METVDREMDGWMASGILEIRNESVSGSSTPDILETRHTGLIPCLLACLVLGTSAGHKGDAAA